MDSRTCNRRDNDDCRRLFQVTTRKTTLIVDQVNRFKACSCKLQSLVLFSEMNGDGLEALLQAAIGGDIFVRRQERSVSRNGLARSVELQGSLVCQLFDNMTSIQQDDIFDVLSN